MEWIRSQLEPLSQYETLWWWLFAVSVALVVLTPAAVSWVVVQLPKDYFTVKRRPLSMRSKKPSVAPKPLVLLKNALGAVLVLAGIAMFVLPGQGMLTLVAGLMLLDFPGKYRLERRLALQKHVWRSINWLRKRFGKEPLEKPKQAAV
jgi:hypothetical protein